MLIRIGISSPFQVFTIHFFSENDGEMMESDYIIRRIKEIWDSFSVSVLLTKYGSNYIGLLRTEESSFAH